MFTDYFLLKFFLLKHNSYWLKSVNEEDLKWVPQPSVGRKKDSPTFVPVDEWSGGYADDHLPQRKRIRILVADPHTTFMEHLIPFYVSNM